MNVVHLKDWQHRRPRPTVGRPGHLRVIEPGARGQQPIAPPSTDMHDAFAAHEDRRRMRQNLGAVAMVVLIVAVGGWLISQIQASSRIQACFDYGHRNCVPLNLGHTASQANR